MEMDLKQKQLNEAIKRMEKLDIMKSVIREFKNCGTIYYSERANSMFPAILYWLDNNKEWMAMARKFEEENGAMVYHAQLTHTKFGDMLSLLFVSKYEEEWKYEREDMDAGGYVQAMVFNLDDDNLSDFGTIQVEPSMGGIVRVA